MEADQALLLALFLLFKKFGKDDTITFPVEDDEPMPKDGLWTFGTMYSPEAKVITMKLIEGKEELDKLGVDYDRTTGAKEAPESKYTSLREKWLGQDAAVSNIPETSIN